MRGTIMMSHHRTQFVIMCACTVELKQCHALAVYRRIVYTQFYDVIHFQTSSLCKSAVNEIINDQIRGTNPLKL